MPATFCDAIYATFILYNLDTHVLLRYMVYADLQIFLQLYFMVNDNHNLFGISELILVWRYHTRFSPQALCILVCDSVVALQYSIGCVTSKCTQVNATKLCAFCSFNDLEVLHFPIFCSSILNNWISLPQIISVGFITNLRMDGPIRCMWVIVLREYMQGLTVDALKDWDLSDIYINEQGRITFARFSFQYHLDNFTFEIIQNCKGVF